MIFDCCSLLKGTEKVHIYFQILLEYRLITILAVFGCRHRNNIRFVSIYLVLYPKTHSAGYSNNIVVV